MSAMLSCLKRLLWRLVDPKAAFPQSAQTLPFSNKCILLVAIPATGEV
jgi:hypothetical protein